MFEEILGSCDRAAFESSVTGGAGLNGAVRTDADEDRSGRNSSNAKPVTSADVRASGRLSAGVAAGETEIGVDVSAGAGVGKSSVGVPGVSDARTVGVGETAVEGVENCVAPAGGCGGALENEYATPEAASPVIDGSSEDGSSEDLAPASIEAGKLARAGAAPELVSGTAEVAAEMEMAAGPG
jgi:hypothetical protein